MLQLTATKSLCSSVGRVLSHNLHKYLFCQLFVPFKQGCCLLENQKSSYASLPNIFCNTSQWNCWTLDKLFFPADALVCDHIPQNALGHPTAPHLPMSLRNRQICVPSGIKLHKPKAPRRLCVRVENHLQTSQNPHSARWARSKSSQLDNSLPKE